MIALATLMARYLWRAMLWLIRRPIMKRLQRASLLLVPKPMRERARLAIVRQNKIARRTGLPILIFMMCLLLGSLLVAGTFSVAMYLYEHGYLTIPRRLRRRMFEAN